MTAENVSVGVQIARVNEHGTERLIVRPMAREAGDSYPRNVGTYDTDKLNLCNLSLNYHIDERDRHLFGGEAEYRAFMILRLPEIEQMAYTLKRVNAKFSATQSYEIGDRFVAFCSAIGAKWCVVEMERRGSWLRDSNWRFMSVAEGRNEIRSLSAKIAAEKEPETRAA